MTLLDSSQGDRADSQMLSLIVPIYKSAANIPALIEALGHLHGELGGALEVVLVVDGSPDESHILLREALPKQPYRSTLVALSRNFGSFSAIRAGLAVARGQRVAVMAADLQEPRSSSSSSIACCDRETSMWSSGSVPAGTIRSWPASSPNSFGRSIVAGSNARSLGAGSMSSAVPTRCGERLCVSQRRIARSWGCSSGSVSGAPWSLTYGVGARSVDRRGHSPESFATSRTACSRSRISPFASCC